MVNDVFDFSIWDGFEVRGYGGWGKFGIYKNFLFIVIVFVIKKVWNIYYVNIWVLEDDF